MDPPDIGRPGEIGDRPRDPEHAGIAARRQPHRLGRLGQQGAPGIVGSSHRLEQIAIGLGIGAGGFVGVTPRLDLPRRHDAPRDFRRSLGGWWQNEIGGADRLNLDVQVDAIT